jgi:membrane-associated phospholipid phosphatase
VTTLERIWLAYAAVAIAVALGADGGGGTGHRPLLFAALHLLLASVQFAIAAAARRWPPARVRVLRALASCAGLPLTFSSYAWLLPAVHPEPYEYCWLAADRALFGGDLSAAALAALPPVLLTALQLIYASFYLLPIAAGLLVARARGAAAFDRAMAILVGCFLASYLGYLLFPTLPPEDVLVAGGNLGSHWVGSHLLGSDGVAGAVHRWLGAAEVNRWDCFPSGHTMLAVASAIVVWRWARAAVAPVLAMALPLIASTVCLRYHWPADVAAGALCAWPAVRTVDLLLARDGTPSA